MAMTRAAMLAPLLCLLAPAALAQQPAPAATPALGAADRIAGEKLIAEAKDLYYADKPAGALADIGEATGRLEKTAFVPLADRVLLQLWRATLFLANDSAKEAEEEAREAVALDPASTVDLSIFPPAVAGLVAKVKQSAPPAHELQPRGLPPGAKVWLDGRSISRGATVTEGRHWLDVDAPGYVHRVAAFDAGATEPVVVDASLTPLPHVTPAPTPVPVARTPLVRRPLFWGIVAAGALALAGGAALAYTPPARTTTEPNGLPTTGTVSWH